MIIAVPFFAAIGLAFRLNSGPIRTPADAANPGFVFSDATKAAGITFVHKRPSFDPKIANVEPHVAALGASVSVTDFDGDGWPDLYFTNSRFGEPNALYRNKGDGTFEDVAANAGVADLNRPGEGVSMGSVWGDFDNDGREDLLVYRYGYLALLKNVDGKRFEDVTQAAGLRRWVNSNGAIWFDYDRDGLLDLYVTAYFRSDIDLWHLTTTRIMHNSFEFADNGGKNLLFHNVGGGKFEDVTDKLGVGSTRWTLAAASADFNEDGWPDLYLANDYGPEELFLNDHGRRFVPVTAGLSSESKSGMSVALGDVFNRGRLDAFVTQHLGAGLPVSEQQPSAQPDGGLEALRQRRRRSGGGRRLGMGRAVRGPQQRRHERAVRRERIHLRRSEYELLVRDVEDRRREWALLRGRGDLAAVREREPLRLRAVARLSQPRRRRLDRRCRTRWSHRHLRRPRRRARRPREPWRGRCHRRKSEPTGDPVPHHARLGQPLGCVARSSARAVTAAR